MCCMRRIEITCTHCGHRYKVWRGDCLTPSDFVHVCPKCLKAFCSLGGSGKDGCRDECPHIAMYLDEGG